MTLRKRVKAAVFKAMMQGEQGQEQVVDTIARLMKQQHVEGNPQEWVAPYNTELNEVIRRRMRELVGQEKERVRKRNLAVKLRMLLELKRCGRKKCRLILQGFREPYYWDTTLQILKLVEWCQRRRIGGEFFQILIMRETDMCPRDHRRAR